MSDFLFVIPEGWTQIDLTGQTSITYESAATMPLLSMTEALRELGLISAEQSVYAAQVFNNEVFVVQLV